MDRTATWWLGPEAQLIVHACRAAFATVSAPAPRDRDPARAIELARRLGVLGLVSSWARTLPGADPRWHRAWLTNLTRNLAAVDELEQWRNILRADGIEIIVFKGPALASRAFGGLHRRDWGDLDIIVPPAEFARAAAILAAHGATPIWDGPPPTREWVEGRGVTFTVAARGGSLLLDLHAGWRQLWGALPGATLTDAALVDVDLGGVRFRTLDAELSALHAACHFAQHGYTLKTLVDVMATLARVRAEGRLDALRDRARSMRLSHTLDAATIAGTEFLEHGRAQSIPAGRGMPTVLTDPAYRRRFDVVTWLETRRTLGHAALLRDAVRTIWLPRGYMAVTPEWVEPDRVRLRRLTRFVRLAATVGPAITGHTGALRRRLQARAVADPRGVFVDLAVAAAIGGAAGIGIGLALATAGGPAAVGALALLAVVLGIACGVAPGTERGGLARLAAVALSVRLAAAAVLYAGAIATGRGGFITGDDRGYSEVAWGYAQWLHGAPLTPYVPPGWGGEASLLGTFTFLVSAIYYVFGHQPLLVSFVNAATVSVALLLVWDIGRRLFGATSAAIAITLVALDPVNILFSALHLKDSLSLLIVAAVIWSIIRFQAHPAFHRLAAAAVGITLMYSIRSYLSFVLLGVALVGSALPRGVSGWTRLTWSASAAIACGGALAVGLLLGTTSMPSISLASFERVRIAMAQGANTAFSADPMPGDAAEPARDSGEGPAPAAPIGQPADAPVTLEQTPLPAMFAGLRILSACLFVGWIVSRSVGWRVIKIAAIGTLAAFPLWLVGASMSAGGGGIIDAESLGRTIGYLPRGLSNLFLAPYPWAIRRLLDIPTIPAMLGWYAILGAALSLIVHRSKVTAPTVTILVFVGTMFVLLFLTEGNVGTLFRHRAMTVAPFVTLLAAPVFLQLWGVSKRRLRSRR
jgi:hypothetical protein